MDYTCVLVEKKENIFTITLNRPKAFNALDVTLTQEVERALEECSSDPEVRVVILTGAGAAFCGGGDIQEFDSNPKGAPYCCHEITKYLNRAVIEIRRMPHPVIACINGGVGGGGLSLAAACDLRIASSSAKFSQGYTRIGLVPDGAWTLTIPLLVGWGRACEMFFTNPLLTAEEAKEWGLINWVVPPEQLKQATWELAKRLAEGPRQSFAIGKQNLNRALMTSLEAQLEEDRRGLVMAAQTADAREGFRAFLEKRKPQFN
ncbi:MAG: hypothetical protein GX295_10590 [Syntrophomonadaceae bacterium]|nr:hypothetical protein [Syntrophomonadaceae bacterium]